MTDPLLDRDGITRALSALAVELRRQRVVADVYLVGGAAMTLAYDERRATRDLDGLLRPHGDVTRAVRTVARQLGLPGSWLNDQAAAYVPTAPDARARPVFDDPNLRVMAASPERLLAMKVQAARPGDIGDIVVLARLLGVRTLDEVEAIRAAAFPDLALDDRRRLVVEDALRSIMDT